MNTLALVRKVCRRIGYEEPATLTQMTTEQAHAYEWVQDAWEEIQIANHVYDFMTSRETVNLLVGKVSYTKVELSLPGLSRWLTVGTIISDESDFTNNVRMKIVTPELMTELHDISPKVGKPTMYSSDLNGTLRVYPTPDTSYFMKADGYATPIELILDTDVPACNEEHHKTIYHLALHKYSIADNDPELEQQSSSDYEARMNRLEMTHCPQVSLVHEPEYCECTNETIF